MKLGLFGEIFCCYPDPDGYGSPKREFIQVKRNNQMLLNVNDKLKNSGKDEILNRE